jgi:hypothetical protein
LLVLLSEVVVQVLVDFNSELFFPRERVPFLELLANNAMHLFPFVRCEQKGNKILHIAKNTAPMAPVPP